MNVEPGQTFFIRLDSRSGSQGAYDLRVAIGDRLLDDHGNASASATLLTSDSAGSFGSLARGQIDIAGDADWFRFVAPASGQLSVRVEAQGASQLLASLEAFSAKQVSLAFQTATQAISQGAAVVRFGVVAGQTYYLAVGSHAASGAPAVGAYRIVSSIATAGVGSTDDFSGTLAGAVSLKFSQGTASVHGVLETSADTDTFKLIVPANGRLLIQLAGEKGGGAPAADLQILGADSRPVGTMLEAGADGLWEFTHTPGSEVFLCLSSLGDGAQGYVISAMTDEMSGLVASAQIITPDDTVRTFDGAIQVAGDIDLIGIKTTQEGRLIARIDPKGAVFAASLEIVNAAGDVLATGELDAKYRLQISLVIQPDQMLFARVSGVAGAFGRYQLMLKQVADDQPDQPELAHANLALDTKTTGAVQFDGDLDSFVFTADQAGDYLFHVVAGAGLLDPRVTIYGEDGALLGADDNSGKGTAALLSLSLEAGQVALVQVGGKPGGGIGAYTIEVAPERIAAGDDYADTLRLAGREASSLLVPVDGTVTAQGQINRANDADVFVLTVPTDGRYEIVLKDATSLKPRLDLLDATGQLLVTDDVGGQGVDAYITRVMEAGERVYLRVTGLSGSMGGYTLQFREFKKTQQEIPDDVGNTLETSRALTLDASGLASFSGAIETSGDVDYFTVQMPADGMLLVNLGAAAGSQIDTVLQGRLSTEATWQFNNNATGTTDSSLVIEGKAGATVQIKASNFGAIIGNYNLQLHYLQPVLDDFANDFTAPASLASASTGVQAGKIESIGDRDLFVLNPQFSGLLTVGLQRPAGGTLTPQLRVYSADGTMLAQDNDSGTGVNSLIQVRVESGVPVYLQAGSSVANTGNYLLDWSLAEDDFGGTPGSAGMLQVVNNTVSQPARLGNGLDTDWFQFVADKDGLVIFGMESTNSSSGLLPYLFVLDSSLSIIGSHSPGGGQKSEIPVQVVAGQKLYLQASSQGRTFGDYLITSTIVADDFGSTPAAAFTVAVDANNEMEALSGAIDISHDQDWFQFTASADGRVRITLTGVDGFDPSIAVYDASMRLLAINDDFGGTVNSRVDVRLLAGEVYYAKALGFGTSSGGYSLKIAAVVNVPDDFADTLDLAAPVFLDEAGIAAGTGVLGDDTDNDCFGLVAPVTGTGTVILNSDINARVRVYAMMEGGPVQIGSATGVGTITVPFPITQGQPVFFRVDSPTGATGAYRYSLVTDTVISADRPMDPALLSSMADEFNNAFLTRIASMQTEADIYSVQRDIAADLVASYIAANGLPGGNVLLVFLDPVDCLMEDPGGRQVGSTTGGGTVLENPAASVSSRGALDLVVISNAEAGKFSMQLGGVGGGRVMAGATMLTKDGSTINPLVSIGGQGMAGNIPVGEVPKEGMQLVLDFRQDTGGGDGG